MIMLDFSPAPLVIDAGPAPAVVKQDPYETACFLRIEAESGCDPELYELAAKAFFILDMPSAGTALITRANHYRNLQWLADETAEEFSGITEYTQMEEE